MKHPVFARVYPRLAAWAETAGAAEHRRELLAGATGRVIEIGAGHGANFPHYPATVTEVLAVEPEPTLRAQAERAARSAPIPVTVAEGTAEALPAADSSFDVAVTSLVLCSVRDVPTALREIRRVLRGDGELRFYEHIRSHDRRFARYQRFVDVLWPRFSGGCHLVRPTDETIAESGFTVTEARYLRFPAPAVPMSPHVLGTARITGH
ncbi:class I SAM-dependent methyltransferase [Amycolatopsis cynarae]|uniref:Class I SAM-dependent methyltransferase n=1 Tax=Amycolatopsis cynarae TaxID=2995223 RepID=A0ABY7AZ43_9PSEU|nr:class I SAM-dependent methyltransferase [Amycolatopsis sp. HUAS 11-8]WAL63931.1 class I SAM-dependent methyltransferase [Amycolatopsis sp. HUAS 11-8]